MTINSIIASLGIVITGNYNILPDMAKTYNIDIENTSEIIYYNREKTFIAGL